MKRIILLALVVLAASSCATTTQPPSNANANANANVSASPSATPKAEVNTTADTIIAREKEIWDKIKTKNPEAFSAMLADDFVYVTEGGVFDRAGTTDNIKQMAPTDISFADWKVVPIDKDAAVVTYTVTMKGTSGGQPMPTAPVRASSVWVNRGGTWTGVFHQDTQVMEAPAGQPAAAKPASGATANANTSAAPPTDAEAADPISKEKRVWDELKRKDYDSFASDLADEAIEVEPDGVYDKAGSINGVKMFDASKYSLSGFKETKLDADASVVTYTVKTGDGKEEERHSTVWSKRGQRWYAVLHQGTPVKKK
ncbi:MAG TPA: nuclear transport factor 2 family protein [Pyrinomonadaceae bacterium]|jgi:hypothetical protein